MTYEAAFSVTVKLQIEEVGYDSQDIPLSYRLHLHNKIKKYAGINGLHFSTKSFILG